MGNAEYRSVEEAEEKELLDDPTHIEQPARNAEIDHVVIKLPKYLKIKPILKSLFDRGYIEDEHGFFEYEKMMCIQCDNEKTCKVIVQYLNKMYGNIASLGFKAVHHTYKNIHNYDTLGHIATVHNAIGSDPNDQYQAYERTANEKSGLPQYETCDVERKLRFMRPHMAKQQKKLFAAKKREKKPKPRVVQNQFGISNVTFNSKNQDQEQASMDMKAAGMSMFSGSSVQAQGEFVSTRKAVELDYTHKARKLRDVTRSHGLSTNNSTMVGATIMNQFTRDHTRNLIDIKKKKWQLNRTKRIYQQQSDKRLEQTYLKQRYDPVIQKRRHLAAQTLWNTGGKGKF